MRASAAQLAEVRKLSRRLGLRTVLQPRTAGEAERQISRLRQMARTAAAAEPAGEEAGGWNPEAWRRAQERAGRWQGSGAELGRWTMV